MHSLGIDIGGSGIKGAVVDTSTGRCVTDRIRLKTPKPATPKATAAVVTRIVEHFAWRGPIGCGMPGPIVDGRVIFAANLHPKWEGVDSSALFTASCGRSVQTVNDADAAGVAEMRFGAGKKQKGVAVIVTLGTGIGSAVFLDGKLLPNTELGQFELRGRRAELRASALARTKEDLSWQRWGKRLQDYLSMLELLLRPDLIVIGGGVSRKANKFLRHLSLETRVVPAALGNEAGIVGAALSARLPRKR
jgi:polyphosphate glucokinase